MLMKLALALLDATATVHNRVSAIELVNGILRNKIGYIWCNDSWVTYTERDAIHIIDNEAYGKVLEHEEQKNVG